MKGMGWDIQSLSPERSKSRYKEREGERRSRVHGLPMREGKEEHEGDPGEDMYYGSPPQHRPLSPGAAIKSPATLPVPSIPVARRSRPKGNGLPTTTCWAPLGPPNPLHALCLSRLRVTGDRTGTGWMRWVGGWDQEPAGWQEWTLPDFFFSIPSPPPHRLTLVFMSGASGRKHQ